MHMRLSKGPSGCGYGRGSSRECGPECELRRLLLESFAAPAPLSLHNLTVTPYVALSTASQDLTLSMRHSRTYSPPGYSGICPPGSAFEGSSDRDGGAKSFAEAGHHAVSMA
jgi:hypothetical protein